MKIIVPLIGIIILLLINSSCSSKKQKGDSPPNIVFFLTDDQCINSLGCYGNSLIETPNIDRLAADGVLFKNCFSNSSSCSPNRSVILTGLQNHTNGMYGLNHGTNNFNSFNHIKALPNLLNEAGYTTAVVGKNHLSPKSVYNFDQYLAQKDAHNHLKMVEASKGFIESANKPFFLFYCTGDPHVAGGKVESSPFKPDRFGNKDGGYPGIKEKFYNPENVEVPNYLPDLPSTRAELAQYYQAVSRLDQGLGLLINMLTEIGEYDNTIIIFSSDNGHAMPMCKATLYDAGIHLPLIIKTPDMKAKGIENDALVSFIDFAPTILDFAGGKYSEKQFHGQSFKTVLEQSNPKGWDEVYGSHTFHLITWYYPRRMVRTKEYKLIRNITYQVEDPAARKYHSTWKDAVKNGLDTYGKRKMKECLTHPEFELYNLKDDPDEIINLAYHSEYQDVFEKLLTKLNDFQKNTKDPWYPDRLKMP